MRSEDIVNRQWTEKERETLRRVAKKQAIGDDSGVTFEDMPRLTSKQLANMVRLRDVRRVSCSRERPPSARVAYDWLSVTPKARAI